MRNLMKKICASFLAIAVMATCLPIDGLVIPGMESLEVQAATVGNDIDYLDDQHAKALIGFIYDKSKLTDEMMNAGGMYTFLTGGYERGSVEEITARIAFLTAAKANLSQCMSKYDTVTENSYNQLLETLTEMAGGDIDDGIANDVLGDVVDSVEEIFLTLSKDGEEVGDVLSTVKTAYGSITSIPGKIEKMKQAMEIGLSSFFHIWGSNRANMYKYVDAYVSNRPLKDSCPSAFEATMSYNVFALNQSAIIYDPVLDWASDEHMDVLNTFGDFIYQVQKSLVSYVSYSQTYKTYEVHCPTDVYLYQEDGNLALSIINNEISIYREGIYAAEYDSEKIITTPSDQDYTLKIVGTDSGVMDYAVYEYSAGSMVRFLEFNDLPVESTSEYVNVLPQEVCVEKEEYALVNENNEVFTADYDSLPEVSSDITDVVVAEELFGDFPTELVELMADVLFNMKESVSLSSYGISIDDSVALFSAIAKYYPSEYSLIANGDFSYQIIYDSKTRTISEIRFDYGKDADLEKFKTRVASLKEKIASIVADIEDMDDFEKALYVHDYIILNCEYDLELMELLEAQGKLNGELRSERYTEYSVLVNQTGICGSYALAYRAILNAAGMECVYVSSEQMNHAWNMVKIDGKWYHVDLCWDDPMPDSLGRAMRTYFLRTDEEMMNLNHYSWTPTEFKASSELYSEMPRGNDFVLKYDDCNDCWYSLESGKLYRLDKDGTNKELISSEISANAIECDAGKVYLIDDNFIYEYELESEKQQPVYYMSSYDAGADPAQAYIKNAIINGNDIILYKYQMNYVLVGDEYELQPETVYAEDLLQKEKLASITGIIVEDMPVQMSVLDTAYPYAYLTSDGDYDIWDLVIEWNSSDENVVTVDEYGTIKAMNVGTATVTASFMEFEESFEITVAGSEETPSGTAGTNIEWNLDLDSGTLSLTGSGAMNNYTYGSAPWYSYASQIKKIEIGENITTVGTYAFAYSDGLTAVELPSTLTSIGANAFLFCTVLEEIEIPAGVTTVGDGAFYCCINIRNVVLPDGLTTLGDSAFSGCDGLESINIPSGITEIGEYTFDGCASLKQIDLTGVTYLERNAFSGCKSLSELVIPASVTIISQGAFENCSGLKSVSVVGNNLDILSSNVFSGCSKLESVQLSESIKVLYGSLFQNCTSLKNITIPSGVTTIENHVFAGCKSLEEIVIPGSVTSISNNSVFDNCEKLEKIVVEETNPNYTSVDGVLFSKDKTVLIAYPAGKTQTHFTVPEGVKTIDWNAFYGNSVLESLVLSDSVTSIEGNGIAQLKKLTSITMSKNIESISGGAFAGCSALKQIELPDTLTTLGRGAFTDCTSLTEITLPDSITLIEQWTFEDCTSLRSVVLPESLEEVDYAAFEGCSGLAHVGYPQSEEAFNSVSIYQSGNDELLGAEHFHYDFDVDSDLNVTEAKDATCTEDGNTASIYCVECDYILSGESISALGHDYQIINHFEGNCTEVTYDEYECTLCKHTYKEYGNPRDGHSYEQTVTAPTCTQKGYIMEVCSVCQEIAVSGFVPPTGHHLSIDKTQEYCPDHGTYQYQCSGCDYVEYVTVSSESLSKKTVNVEPTCTQSGSIKEICELCEATISTKILNPTGHSFSEEWTIDEPVTCKEAGLKSKHCANCDAKKDVTVIDVTEGSHRPELQEGQKPSCTEDGFKDYYECECGGLFEDEEGTIIIESLEVWKTEKGKIPAVHEYGDLIPEQKEIHTKDELKAAVASHYICSACGEYFTEQKEKTTLEELTGEVPVHIPDIAEPTETADQKCSECGYVIAPAIGHIHKNNLSYVAAKEATCTEDGNIAHYKCKCGLYFSDANAESEIKDSVVIKASHKYGDLIPEQKEIHTKEELKAAVASHYICSACGEYFTEQKEKTTLEELTGEVPVHTYGDWVSSDDKHWKECVCGSKKEEAAHTGGTATGTAQAVCEECKAPYGSLAGELPFVDVRTGDWFYNSVEYVYYKSLMTGMTSNTFGPAINLSRAQFAVILWRMNGSPVMNYRATFPDVPAGTWYTDAVLWANQNGIITGYSHNGHFGSADNITREQMALMMYRYANSKDYDTSKKADFGSFKDAAKVSAFAKEGMQWAVGNSIITGKENGTAIDPQGNASRAECATIIMRFLKLYE